MPGIQSVTITIYQVTRGQLEAGVSPVRFPEVDGRPLPAQAGPPAVCLPRLGAEFAHPEPGCGEKGSGIRQVIRHEERDSAGAWWVVGGCDLSQETQSASPILIFESKSLWERASRCFTTDFSAQEKGTPQRSLFLSSVKAASEDFSFLHSF